MLCQQFADIHSPSLTWHVVSICLSQSPLRLHCTCPNVTVSCSDFFGKWDTWMGENGISSVPDRMLFACPMHDTFCATTSYFSHLLHPEVRDDSEFGTGHQQSSSRVRDSHWDKMRWKCLSECVCVYMHMSVGIGRFGMSAPLMTQNCGVQVISGHLRAHQLPAIIFDCKSQAMDTSGELAQSHTRTSSLQVVENECFKVT